MLWRPPDRFNITEEDQLSIFAMGTLIDGKSFAAPQFFIIDFSLFRLRKDSFFPDTTEGPVMSDTGKVWNKYNVSRVAAKHL